MVIRAGVLREPVPVSLILAVSMVPAGVVYPVMDSAPKHTSPIMIATSRALCRRPDSYSDAAAATRPLATYSQAVGLGALNSRVIIEQAKGILARACRSTSTR
jgi:hypothetical protein